ncbi:DUF924 family protein [Hydrogenophaga sp.]|uniref:DUF924 family protein n=1 Tax=Hydrogenophaga sp. TaxID=1904254 RepID=UPI0027191045|nr:DUF924 family protein [Hydrogenophaga sp.]MDO8906473.1 DUF924 family protein [Hydrogenophaga sp.]
MNTPSSSTPATETPSNAVLTFWLGDALKSDWPEQDRNDLWFGGGAAQDQLITQQFGHLVEQALAGGLAEWETTLDQRLALIIVLDQFTRNVHRGTAQAFAGDARAQQLVLRTLAQDEDKPLPRVARIFLYMPLMHAEHLALQEACVAHFTELAENAPRDLRETLNGNLKFALEHRDIVAAYGRFPYRNEALGRETTAEELEFLKNGPRFGQ